MGQRFQQKCKACGYSAEVSGRGDAGMLVITTTIVCLDCKELYDFIVCYHGHAGGPKTAAQPISCPKTNWHRVTQWKTGDDCPKCGDPMVQGVSTLIWD
jgi:hypothetical protein